MYIYIFIHTHIHIYTHIYIYIYIYIHTTTYHTSPDYTSAAALAAAIAALLETPRAAGFCARELIGGDVYFSRVLSPPQQGRSRGRGDLDMVCVNFETAEADLDMPATDTGTTRICHC